MLLYYDTWLHKSDLLLLDVGPYYVYRVDRKSHNLIRGVKSKVKTKLECILIIRMVKLCLQILYYW